GYSTPSGTTYNAYLINDTRPTLIDTVKEEFFSEMLERIREVMDPAGIVSIISNHTEMDHSGSIRKMLEVCPKAEVICSPKGAEGLLRHFKKTWNLRVVKTGDVLDTGGRPLQFVLMPMVHWPDSMATYAPNDHILFSNDAFGQHHASHERFADEINLSMIYREAAKYYGNIVMPYGKQVQAVLKSVATLPIDQIFPSHGLMWRRTEDIQKIVALYDGWSRHQTQKKVVIVFDSMWHSTERMAERLCQSFKDARIPVVFLPLQHTHISDVVTEILEARLVLFGTPILNNRMLPSMAALMMYLKGLKPTGRLAFTFGSYGWSLVGFKELENSVIEAGFTLAAEGRYINYVPDEVEWEQLSQDVAG
ncbi:MAG TPA: FprA family A-type flavoprotein, partial [bacterium]|nr:FprA family A-type flavoprotein [bacterium]